jgi:sulfoxide reductase catalytic subunit YedY
MPRIPKIPSSEITSRPVYLNRRSFIQSIIAAGGAALAGDAASAQPPAPRGAKLKTVPSKFSTTEKPNSWEHITTYNNFYEFGTDKSDPAIWASRWRMPPQWTVSIEGEVAKPGRMNLEDILKGETLEDRIYRHRCVEGWSMIIPWVGFPLANLIKKVEPTSKARFVEFVTYTSSQMRGLDSDVLEWPYLEGLRLDEAMHPLTIMAVGLYGEVLPKQNGAPMHLVVPWKYGFKGAKSISRIRFVERQPRTSWMKAWSEAYGFYSNVNPNVDHPRHSQATEARLPSFRRNTPTLMFNGYGDQVASLYKGMDLARNY